MHRLVIRSSVLCGRKTPSPPPPTPRRGSTIARLAIAALCTTLPIAAQNAFVVPPAAESYSTMLSSRLIPWTHYQSKRVQVLYDTASISLAQGSLTSLQLRPTWETPLGSYSAYAQSINMTVTMSVSPVDHTAASTDFASNHGPNPIQVFQGQVYLPAYQSLPAWPAPWVPPIVFQTPFPFDRSAGLSLVVDLTATGVPNGFWGIEEYGRDGGVNQLAWAEYHCRTAANRQPGVSYGLDNLAVGGFHYQSSCCYSNIPSFAVNALLFGFDGPGDPYLGLTLPIPLSSLGLPGNPACRLATAPAFAAPMQYSPGTGSSPTTSFRFGPAPIPNDPALIHVGFYTQHVLLDTDAAQNNMVYTAPAFWWRIGSGDPLPASEVVADYSATATTGWVRSSRGISLRLGY